MVELKTKDMSSAEISAMNHKEMHGKNIMTATISFHIMKLSN